MACRYSSSLCAALRQAVQNGWYRCYVRDQPLTYARISFAQAHTIVKIRHRLVVGQQTQRLYDRARQKSIFARSASVNVSILRHIVQQRGADGASSVPSVRPDATDEKCKAGWICPAAGVCVIRYAGSLAGQGVINHGRSIPFGTSFGRKQKCPPGGRKVEPAL